MTRLEFKKHFWGDAMVAALEKENNKLCGVLYLDLSRLPIDADKIADLLKIISHMKSNSINIPRPHNLAKSTSTSSAILPWKKIKTTGRFYTPRTVARTLVEILVPFTGRLYDPC